jgi:hypothetical protein
MLRLMLHLDVDYAGGDGDRSKVFVEKKQWM